MNEEGSERGRKLRVGVFVLIGVAGMFAGRPRIAAEP